MFRFHFYGSSFCMEFLLSVTLDGVRNKKTNV